MTGRSYRFIVYRNADGFRAEAETMPGCAVRADTLEELRSAALAAARRREEAWRSAGGDPPPRPFLAMGVRAAG